MKSAIHARVALGLIVILAAALRLHALVAVGAGADPIGDEKYYVAHGTQLAAGQGYGDSQRPPLWPALIAIVLAAGGTLDTVRAVGIVLSLASLLLVADLAQSAWGPRAAVVAGAAFAIEPTLVHYTHLLWAENLFVFWILLGLWLLERARGGSLAWSVGAGLALGAATLTKEVVLSFAPFVLWWLWRATPDKRRAFRQAVGFTVAVAAAVLPWTARNHAIDGRAVLVSTFRWFPIALGNFGADEAARARFYRDYLTNPDEVGREAMARTVALQAIARQQPGWIGGKLAANLPRLFAPGVWVSEQMEGPTRVAPLSFPETIVYAAVMLAGVAGLWLVPDGRLKWLVVALILYFLAVHVVANATPRFRLPIVALLAWGAGALPDFDRRRLSGWRAVGALASALVLLAAVLDRAALS